MGRVKTDDIKKCATSLMKQNRDRFKTTFEQNKLALEEMRLPQTKRIRNKIAGYITKTMRRESKE